MRIVRKIQERIALNAYAVGDYRKAERLFARLAAGGESGPVHNLGLARLALKDYAGAEACFLREIERNGESFVRLRTLGDLYFGWERRQEAAERYAAALACGASSFPPPPDVDSAYVRARAELCASEEAFSLALGAAAELERGNVLMSEKKWDEAYAAFERAASLDPVCYPALNNLGVIAMNQRKDHRDAVGRFSAAAALTSAPAVRANLARAEERAGHGGG